MRIIPAGRSPRAAKHRGKHWPRSAAVARPYQGAGASHASGRVIESMRKLSQTWIQHQGLKFPIEIRDIFITKKGWQNYKQPQYAKEQQKGATCWSSFGQVDFLLKHFRRVSPPCPGRTILPNVNGQKDTHCVWKIHCKGFLNSTVPMSTTTIP